jgi:hypothetical protein
MKIKLCFKWQDLRIGLCVDTKINTLYIHPLPMIRVSISVPQRHYVIIGKYSQKPIGCCYSCGKADVLEEEPGSTLIRIRKRDCPICGRGASES